MNMKTIYKYTLYGYSGMCGIYSSIIYNTCVNAKPKYELDLFDGLSNMIIGPIITPICIINFANDIYKYGIKKWKPEIRKKWNVENNYYKNISILPLFQFEHQKYNIKYKIN